MAKDIILIFFRMLFFQGRSIVFFGREIIYLETDLLYWIQVISTKCLNFGASIITMMIWLLKRHLCYRTLAMLKRNPHEVEGSVVDGESRGKKLR